MPCCLAEFPCWAMYNWAVVKHYPAPLNLKLYRQGLAPFSLSMNAFLEVVRFTRCYAPLLGTLSSMAAVILLIIGSAMNSEMNCGHPSLCCFRHPVGKYSSRIQAAMCNFLWAVQGCAFILLHLWVTLAVGCELTSHNGRNEEESKRSEVHGRSNWELF